MEGVDDIAFLAASEPRADLLSALAEEDRLSKDELVERSGAVRVTVTRNLEQLQERGLVTSEGRQYRLTPLGELLVPEFLSLAATARTAGELSPLLERLPAGAFDLDPAALSGATVTASTAANPYAPVQRHSETLEQASRARLLLPAFSEQLLATVEERVHSGALDLELVAAPSVAESFRTEAEDLIGSLVAAESLAVFECESPVPFYLGLVDDVVQIGVSDEEGIPRALAESDDETVRSWAHKRYEAHRSAASEYEHR